MAVLVVPATRFLVPMSRVWRPRAGLTQGELPLVSPPVVEVSEEHQSLCELWSETLPSVAEHKAVLIEESLTAQ